MFETGEASDQLIVSFTDAIVQELLAGQIRLSVNGIRGPPTTRAVDGFAI